MPYKSERRRRIAVVEDNDDLRMLLSTWLGRDYEVAGFRCGETLLGELASLKPDLVILDVKLPGADGWEISRRLRARRRFGELPILFLTAVDPEFLAPPAHARGVALLTKPLALDHLVGCVGRLLRASVRRRASLARS